MVVLTFEDLSQKFKLKTKREIHQLAFHKMIPYDTLLFIVPLGELCSGLQVLHTFPAFTGLLCFVL